jgi:alkanesulfonate monooxygenase SsuD/methylene tetrahydromethanopterin reductase-like flavin-dependent oxidoreductase (luciferase family)
MGAGRRLRIGGGNTGPPAERRGDLGCDALQGAHSLRERGQAGAELAEQVGRIRQDAIGLHGGDKLLRLAERMWQAVLTVYGAEAAAKHGVGLILNRAAYGHSLPTDQVQLPWVQAYLAGLQGQTTQPRIALSRTIYPADDRPSALADLEEGVVRFAAQVARDGYLPADLSVAEYAARLHILHGHPQELVAAVQADRILPSATDLLCQFSPGLPTLAQAVRALERIATEVAPALGWQPRAPTANA